jgi:hypothetical protein
MMSAKSEDVAKSEEYTHRNCFSKFRVVYSSLFIFLILIIDLQTAHKKGHIYENHC